MKQHQFTEFYIERLQPTWLPTKRVQVVYKVLLGLFVGLASGLYGGLTFGLRVELGWLGLFIWLYGGLTFVYGVEHAEEAQPSEKLTWSWGSFLRSGLLPGLGFGLAIGLLFGLGLGLVIGLSSTQLDEHARLRPNLPVLSHTYHRRNPSISLS